MDDEKIYSDIILDQCAQEWLNVSRRFFLKGIAIVCLGCALFLQGCNDLSARSENTETTGKIGSNPKTMRPPIDVAAPAKTEMATFALG